VKFLRNLIESLRAIIDGQGNCTEYNPEELYRQWALFWDKIYQ
jgi:hypothetical protein